ncbi:hypothetical protein [Bordetella bronchiseptica]|uniref:hypothetical protein n=1 Tax=Bordetella bronchiseptica TaxID=518 RepID=UPI000459B47E|nr:hypothetical protein [Bordetella bronchiseptica]KCV40208.1 hypothetical protein L572_0873 [Bordetella bronchiseptica 345]
MRIRVYATLAILAIAVAGLLAYRQFAPPPEPAAPVEPPPSAERPQPPAPPVLPDPPADSAPPPWAAGNRAQPAPAARPAPAAAPAPSAREQAMAEAHATLQRLSASPAPDLAELDRALRDLEQAHGSPEVGGVRLDVLRANLRVAERLSVLGQQLQALQQQPAGEPGRAEAMRRIGDEVAALQKQLRTDYVVDTPAARP